MSRRTTAEKVRFLAARQWDVVTRQQLLDAEVAPSTITRRVKRGDWRTVYVPGIYDVGHGAFLPR